MIKVPLSQCIAPNFYDLHKMIKAGQNTEYWLRGGRGSTKSSFISIELILDILRDPESNSVVFRRYENEIRDSVFGQMKWAVNKLGVDHLFKFNVSPFKITYEPTGQVILFKGADNPQKIKSINLGKGYVKNGWWEECDQYSGMEEIRNIQQSLFRGTTKKQVAFYSYNPPKSARSWTNAETKIFKPGREVHYSDYRSVPPDWLGETFIANALHLKEVNEDAYNHEYLGQETGTGLEVFNNVTLRKITDKEISYFDHRYQGQDFGYAADPLCFEEFHYDAKKKRIYMFSEISGVGIKNADFIARLSEAQQTELTMADSAEPKTIDELRDDYNMNIMGAQKAPGSVEHGIKWLQDLEEIVIDPERCPLAATEFVNYALQVDRQGNTINKYPDKDNHCFVGSTIISTMTGGRRIDEIQPGELVLTRQGYRPVKKVYHNGMHKVVTTRLLNGKSLTLTDTHNIITKRGDVMFKDLLPSDKVYYEVKGCRFIETENRKLQYFKAKNTEGIQRAKDVMTRYTSRELSKQGSTSTYMWQFICPVSVRFQRIAISTIKMGILSITRLVILSALKAQSMRATMLKSTIKTIKILSRRVLKGFDHLQNSGMLQKKGESGTPKMGRRYGRTGSSENILANTVGNPLKQKTEGIIDSAPINANRRGGDKQDWTILSRFAQPVVRCLKRISILRRRPVQEVAQDVYDLEVEGVHEYFANGLLVHNSIDAMRYGCSLLITEARREKKKAKWKIRAVPMVQRW